MKDATAIGVAILAFIGIVVLATVVGFLLAYPTMWLVNYVFGSAFNAFVFGTATITVWKAWALNILAGFIFKSTSTESSK